MSSVVIIGGFSSPLGPNIIDRLLSQQYMVGVVDQSKSAARLVSVNLIMAEFDEEIPGDFDFAFRTCMRKLGSAIAIIDLMYFRIPIDVPSQYPDLVPEMEDVSMRVLYILLYLSGGAGEKIEEISEKYLNKIFIEINSTDGIELLEPLPIEIVLKQPILAKRCNLKMIHVKDISRLICDYLLRNPISWSTNEGSYYRLSGSSSDGLCGIGTPIDKVLVLPDPGNTTTTLAGVYDFSI